MKKRSNAYWDKRARERMAEYHRSANSTVRTISNAYDEAIKEIEREIEKIFKTFGKNGQLDIKQARKVLNQRIPNPLLDLAKKWYPKLKNEKVKKWLLTRMNAPAYRARITRLEALKEQVFLQSKIIADVEITQSQLLYVNTINQAYYRTMFDIQKGLGIGFSFATMPNRTIETILKNPWSGRHFSSRVWSNTEELAKRVNKVITSGFMSGASNRKMIQELEDLSMLGKQAANRLIRTEITYMANAAEIESYEEADITKYVFMATLDSRTSKICQKLDGQIFEVKKAKAGVNLPSMHPYCRSTTIAYFGAQELKNLQRRARNPVTGKNEVLPSYMTYSEWMKKYKN